MAIGGLFAGVWIFNRGLKTGADIVWKVQERGPSLFQDSQPMMATTTEENDNEILTEDEQAEE